MRLTRTTAWIGGAVLAALVVAAATWLLLVSPRQQAAADLHDQALATAAQNDVLAAQVLALETQLGDVPKTRAAVAELREQLPVDADLATLLRQVTDLAERSGAELTGVTPSEPATATGDAALDAAAVEGAAPTAAAATGVQAVPVTITAEGPFAQVQELLRLVQVDLPRAVLVRGVSLSSAGDGGDLQMTVTADAFLLPATAGEEQLAALPGPVGAGADGPDLPATDLPTTDLPPTEVPATDGAGVDGTPSSAPTPVPTSTTAPVDAAAPPAEEETL